MKNVFYIVGGSALISVGLQFNPLRTIATIVGVYMLILGVNHE